MSKKNRDYIYFLEDILRSIDKIEKYTSGLTLKLLKENEMVLDAVIRNFEIIGEAVKSIPKNVREKYPGIEWKEASGFRDVLIHDYFGIDTEAVHDTIKNNITPFKKKIKEVIKSEKKNKKISK